MKKYSPILVATFLSPILWERDAAAYLDPGTGSFALQVIAASVVAVGFFVRKFWRKIVSFFGRRNVDINNGKKE